jgi:hypothetical protein
MQPMVGEHGPGSTNATPEHEHDPVETDQSEKPSQPEGSKNGHRDHGKV